MGLRLGRQQQRRQRGRNCGRWEHCGHQQQSLDHDSGCPLRLCHRSLAALRQGRRRLVGNNNLTVSNVTTGVSLTCGTFTNLTNCGNNTGGWLVGGGAEWAFAPQWSVKFEYDYLGLGNRTFVIPVTAPLLPGDTFSTNIRNVQMVKVGVNYLFNWGAPAAARY